METTAFCFVLSSSLLLFPGGHYCICTHRPRHRVDRVRRQRGVSTHHRWAEHSGRWYGAPAPGGMRAVCWLRPAVPVGRCQFTSAPRRQSENSQRVGVSLKSFSVQFLCPLGGRRSTHTQPSRPASDLSGIRWNTCYFQVFSSPLGCGMENCSLTVGLMIQLFENLFFFWHGYKADAGLSLSDSILWRAILTWVIGINTSYNTTVTSSSV